MKFEQVKRKIVNPPAAQNLVRLISLGDEVKTTSNVANFALSIPSFNYQTGIGACLMKVQMNLKLETAVSSVERNGSPAGRSYNADLVKAFFEYDKIRKYSSAKLIDGYDGYYMVSRQIRVPTKPTFTILESAKQIPVVMCGWKDLKLERSQIRMWMTMLESGLFSYSDFKNSPAEVVIFPEEEIDGQLIRKPYVIHRGDYELYNNQEMREISAMYARAQEAAMPIAEEKWKRREERRKQKEREEIRQDIPRSDDLSEPLLFASLERDTKE